MRPKDREFIELFVLAGGSLKEVGQGHVHHALGLACLEFQ
jgi:hypothetical protein